MARPKKGSKENPVTTKEMNKILGDAADRLIDENGGEKDANKRTYKITSAFIKDDFCNYRYEITKGLGINDGHDVEGRGLVLDDLKNAFLKFRVHMAWVDGVFRHQGIEVEDIDMFHDDDHVSDYVVTGFKIYGSGEAESIVLMGNKRSLGFLERMKVVTPRIAMDNLSGYKWYNELKAAADIAREEVALYKEGKCIVVKDEEDEDEEEKKKKEKKYGKQLSINSPEARAEDPEEEDGDDNKDTVDADVSIDGDDVDELFETPME